MSTANFSQEKCGFELCSDLDLRDPPLLMLQAGLARLQEARRGRCLGPGEGPVAGGVVG